MSKIKTDVKLRSSCMNAEYFHPKIKVIDLDTALECVYQAIEEGRKEGGNKQSFNAENVLTIVAYLTLIVGIIASVIIIKKEDIALGFGILISSVVTWAVLKVLYNISNNLYEINKKMKG